MSTSLSSESARFYVLGSYGIPDSKAFVLFGAIKSGEVQPGMYAHITLNNSLSLSVKIDEVTKVEFPNDKSIDTLLVIRNNEIESYDLLLSMGVELEYVVIDREGVD